MSSPVKNGAWTPGHEIRRRQRVDTRSRRVIDVQGKDD
jgi:hypothetical protein